MSPYNVFIHCMQRAAYKINIKSQFKEYKNGHRGFFRYFMHKNLKIINEPKYGICGKTN